MPNIDFSKMVTAEQKHVETLVTTQAQFKAAIEGLISQSAHSRNYGGPESLASYVSSTVPQWAAEAQAFVAWRDAVWLYAYAELEKVLTGQRDIPTIGVLLAELPAIVWPDAA